MDNPLQKPMKVESEGECPNCEESIQQNDAQCSECNVPLVWPRSSTAAQHEEVLVCPTCKVPRGMKKKSKKLVPRCKSCGHDFENQGIL